MERRSDAGQKTIFRVANELFAQDMPFDEAMRQLRSELLAYCPNHRFTERFKLDDEENNWYVWPGLKYLLYEYEEHLAKNHAVQMPWRSIAKRPIEQTIEHILPQAPDKPYWTERFDETQLRCFLHDLGNLCLTSDNSVYRNKLFPEKKGSPGSGTACYADSNLFQERALALCEEWTEVAIRKRRERIVSWALQRWHVDDEDVTPMMPDEVNEDVAGEGMAHFLVYWKPSTVVNNEPNPTLNHSASDQYDRVEVGDILWIVSSKEPDDLVLVGRQKVDRILGQAEAERILGSGLWEAEYHAICNEPEDKITLSISLWAHESDFDGGVDCLPEGFTGQYLQSMRRLDYDSANMLEEFYCWLVARKSTAS